MPVSFAVWLPGRKAGRFIVLLVRRTARLKCTGPLRHVPKHEAPA